MSYPSFYINPSLSLLELLVHLSKAVVDKVDMPEEMTQYFALFETEDYTFGEWV